jgi:beta-glucanase (GH16 family)
VRNLKKKYLVTTTSTKVETWEVEAENEEEAALNFEEGELVSEDTQREVSEVQKIED